jgi:hypothetical protein
MTAPLAFTPARRCFLSEHLVEIRSLKQKIHRSLQEQH